MRVCSVKSSQLCFSLVRSLGAFCFVVLLYIGCCPCLCGPWWLTTTSAFVSGKWEGSERACWAHITSSPSNRKFRNSGWPIVLLKIGFFKTLWWKGRSFVEQYLVHQVSENVSHSFDWKKINQLRTCWQWSRAKRIFTCCLWNIQSVWKTIWQYQVRLRCVCSEKQFYFWGCTVRKLLYMCISGCVQEWIWLLFELSKWTF